MLLYCRIKSPRIYENALLTCEHGLDQLRHFCNIKSYVKLLSLLGDEVHGAGTSSRFSHICAVWEVVDALKKAGDCEIVLWHWAGLVLWRKGRKERRGPDRTTEYGLRITEYGLRIYGRNCHNKNHKHVWIIHTVDWIIVIRLRCMRIG